MKIAILDYDDTLSTGIMRYQLGIEMEKAGLIAKGFSSEITELQDSYENRKISYNEKFSEDKKIFTRYYTGVKRLDMVRFLEERYGLEKYIKPWAAKLINQLKQLGFLTVIISGSWDFIIEEAQKYLDFDSFFASEMEFADGKFTGRYKRILDYKAKELYSKQTLHGSDFSIGLGDSQADLSFLQHVDKGFLYLPDERVLEASLAQKLTTVNDKNIINSIIDAIQ